MSLRIHVGNRAERLLEALAGRLSRPLSSPLHKELLVVQSRGMQRWLSLELARHLGVWANSRFPFPNAIISEFFSLTLGADEELLARSNPDVMAWQVMALLPELVDTEPFAPLRGYLTGENPALRLFQLSERIADTLDQYTLYRTAMLQRWERGELEGLEGEAWQAVLWRRLAASWQGAHRGALKERFCRLQGIDASRLPERISLFGISYLPKFHLDVLAAVSGSIAVDLYLLSPTREYWGDIVSGRALARLGLEERRLRTEGNPLLASLGGVGRDFSDMVVDLADEAIEYAELYEEPGEATLLQALQSDMLRLQGTGEEGRRRLQPADGSVQLHACHGKLREVEVLYDNLLRFFEEVEGLQPRDIVVMAPDIESYSPYISAVFEAPRGERIPYTIADRRLLNEGEVATAFSRLLSLRGGRFSSVELFDLLSSPPVMRRFGFDESGLEAVRNWIVDARIRWGIDENDRQAAGLDAYRQNSWRAGLDRLFLGYAMDPEAGVVEGISPFEEFNPDAAAALGQLGDFIDAVEAFADELERPRGLEAWREFLGSVLDRFIAVDEASEREEAAVRAICDRLATIADRSAFEGPVEPEVVVAWLLARLEQHEQGLGFMTGGITFCAMLPMRSIPFRVVALLGMDDGAFPRRDRPAGFDLIAGNPQKGDRSVRAEDRYLFLETLLSARDRLYISYHGQSMRDNSPIPPSVLVSELFDAVERGFELPKGVAAADLLTTRHRLQAFSPAYFESGSPLFSYSAENFEARASQAVAAIEEPPFVHAPLPEPPEPIESVSIEELMRFFENPSATFLRRRLLMATTREARELDEREPFEAGGLEAYRLRERLVESLLWGHDAEALREAFAGEGALPPGEAGSIAFEAIRDEAAAFVARLLAVTGELQPLPPLDLDLDLGTLRLTGRLDRLHRSCQLYRRLSRTKAALRMRAWIAHLALQVVGSEALPADTLLFTRNDAFRFLPAEDPAGLLASLAGHFRQGLREPLVWFPESSLAWVEKSGKGEEAALKAARSAWYASSFSGLPGEGDDAAYRRCFGSTEPFGETFARLALDIAGPMLEHTETLS